MAALQVIDSVEEKFSFSRQTATELLQAKLALDKLASPDPENFQAAADEAMHKKYEADQQAEETASGECVFSLRFWC